jgi:hypothetical protein
MRSNKLFLGVLVGAGLLAAYWFLVLAPKREEATALKAQVAAKQQEVSASEATLATYRQARDAYTSTYARVTSLGKAVPADDDVRSLVVQLEHAATSNKVNFRSIAASASGSPSTVETGAATTLNPPPGAVATAAGFSTMPFTLTFSGDYAHLTDLFTELERFVAVQNEQIRVKGRLMRVDSITLTPRTNATTNELDANVSASTFLVPTAEGVTGAGTTPSTGTTAAAPGGTTTPTTTAAVTGAIE